MEDDEMDTVYTTYESPVGTLLLTGDGASISCLYFEPLRPDQTAGLRRDDEAFVNAVAQLSAYFAGERTSFDLPLELRGTDFQRAVWAALREIPYGETITYGQLAVMVGNPAASRAVGMANNRNPVSIVVPCHRVVGASGTLVGYGGGLDRKRWLLEHEAKVKMSTEWATAEGGVRPR
jgi:methylated-DNA-[protein]-cysteine S-methyltransferase